MSDKNQNQKADEEGSDSEESSESEEDRRSRSGSSSSEGRKNQRQREKSLGGRSENSSGSRSRSRSGARRGSVQRRSDERRSRRTSSRSRSGGRSGASRGSVERRSRSKSRGDTGDEIGGPAEVREARVKLDEADIEELAEKIASKVWIKKEEKEERDKKELLTEDWEEGSEFLLCRPCSQYSTTREVPLELLKSKRGKTLGLISKLESDGSRRPNHRLKQMVKQHSDCDLHKWCVIKSKEVKSAQMSFEEENREAGKVVILSYLKAARRGESSADFMNSINFTHLLSGVPKSTKINSPAIFFDLREDAEELVKSAVKKLVKEDMTEIAVTLDKVTVQSRPYTVILTFFFYMGSIFVYLNRLHKMKPDEYDAEGTARMVCKELQESLGITRTQLSRLLVHFW